MLHHLPTSPDPTFLDVRVVFEGPDAARCERAAASAGALLGSGVAGGMLRELGAASSGVHIPFMVAVGPGASIRGRLTTVRPSGFDGAVGCATVYCGPPGADGLAEGTTLLPSCAAEGDAGSAQVWAATQAALRVALADLRSQMEWPTRRRA
ncbi:MAG: hypothetical protein AB8H79_22465 [Myxococcota bacterium]